MKHYNDFLIVGIDHGYGNIKTANTVTPTGITKLDAAPTFTKNTLFFAGSYYQIGEGHKEYLADKWQDDDNYLFTLMGIARELNREGITSAKVYLAVGLPITWVGRQREDFRKYMLQRESVDFKYEDKLYSVRIIGCYVYPQGYAAVVDKLNDMTGLSMIADIGNGTVNIIFVSNKRVINTKTYTEKMGVNQCVKAASNAMMNKLGVTVDETIIQSMIRYGTADIDSEYAEVLRQAISEYAESIFALLRKYEYDPKMMRLYITGGGGKLIKNFGNYDKDKFNLRTFISSENAQTNVTESITEITDTSGTEIQKNARKYINGHILFFEHKTVDNKGHEIYSGFIGADGIDITVPAGGDAKSVTLYWKWVNTFDQIFLKTTDSYYDFPLIADDNTDDREDLVDFIQANPSKLFSDITTENTTAVQNIDYDADHANSTLLSALNDGYNTADQVIGVNLRYFLIEMIASPAASTNS